MRSRAYLGQVLSLGSNRTSPPVDRERQVGDHRAGSRPDRLLGHTNHRNLLQSEMSGRFGEYIAKRALLRGGSPSGRPVAIQTSGTKGYTSWSTAARRSCRHASSHPSDRYDPQRHVTWEAGGSRATLLPLREHRPLPMRATRRGPRAVSVKVKGVTASRSQSRPGSAHSCGRRGHRMSTQPSDWTSHLRTPRPKRDADDLILTVGQGTSTDRDLG